MIDATATPQCPHCGETLRAFQLPDNTGWDSTIHFACFNDECPYFRRGWSWMFDHYGVKSSYRYRVDPVSGTDSPLPVWSADAIKDRILDAEVIAGPPGDGLSPEKPGVRGQGSEVGKDNSRKADEAALPGRNKSGRKPAAKPGRKGKRP